MRVLLRDAKTGLLSVSANNGCVPQATKAVDASNAETAPRLQREARLNGTEFMLAYDRAGLRSHFGSKSIAAKKEQAGLWRGPIPAWPEPEEGIDLDRAQIRVRNPDKRRAA